jgi:hypothetical protein
VLVRAAVNDKVRVEEEDVICARFVKADVAEEVDGVLPLRA